MFIHIQSATGTAGITGIASYQGDPLAGIAVTLSGAATREATTAADGTYGFEGLPAGSYTVMIFPINGEDMTTVGTIELADGENGTVNFIG